jgi:hypothetical protein
VVAPLVARLEGADIQEAKVAVPSPGTLPH